MKVVLISIATNPEATNVPPLGVLYTATALKKVGYEMIIKHLNPNDILDHVEEIINEKPLFIGFSTFTGTQLKSSAILAKKIKESSNIPIIFGGIHPSLKPKQCVSESYIDYVVIGEGEETIIELANALKNKKSLDNIRGLAFKKNNEIFFTQERPLIKDLDKCSIDWDLVDVEKYIYPAWQNTTKRLISISVSRGCPHRCSFCYNLAFNKGLWRKQSSSFVIKEIEKLKEKYKIDTINFTDDNFFANKEWAFSILEKINIPWKAEIRIDYITDELMKRLVKTQCRELLIGLESGSDHTLKIINKGYTVDLMKKKLKIMSKYPQIRICGSLIVGVPGETEEDINQTIDFILYLARNHPGLILTVGTYLPFPGAPLYGTALKSGFKEPKRTEDWDILDRWTNKMEMPWLPWANKQTLKNFVYIRIYSQMLALKKIRPKTLYKIVRYRLKYKKFNFPIDAIFYSWFRKKWIYPNSFIGSKSFLGNLIRKNLRVLNN